jgi:ATP-dependent Clp protease ATP-binding subunit ClpC
LTDNKGRTVSFKNAIIILTSNVGAVEVKEERTGMYGFGASQKDHTSEQAYEGMKERVTNALKEKFRPEFLNRLDDVIVFHPLSKGEVAKIGEKIIGGLSRRMYEQKGIVLTVTESALLALVEEGYDGEMGARPMKRVIQRRIEDRLSEEILLGKAKNGDRICVDYDGGEFIFRV